MLKWGIPDPSDRYILVKWRIALAGTQTDAAARYADQKEKQMK